MIKYICFPVVTDTYKAFSERCKFYDIPAKEVLNTLVHRFLDGEFDEDFDLPVD